MSDSSGGSGTGGDPIELVVPACEVVIGDDVLVRGEYRKVVKIRKAQGRRPSSGFNLHLFTDGRMVRAHSAHELVVRRCLSEPEGS